MWCDFMWVKGYLAKNIKKSILLVRGKNILSCTGSADKPLARPTSRCILFDGENISFDASLYIYISLIFLQL